MIPCHRRTILFIELFKLFSDGAAAVAKIKF